MSKLFSMNFNNSSSVCTVPSAWSGDGVHGSAAGGRCAPSPMCCWGLGRSDLQIAIVIENH
uniref:hypothetical protein n=1 Tax=Candidatus Cryptobacteroides bacterium TaxID=3085639 RepID=UPI004026E2A4